MRIPFDIKFRPQIESGEYKVIDRFGYVLTLKDIINDAWYFSLRYPNTDHETERIYDHPENHLFIVTPEPEMSEFEQEVYKMTTNKVQFKEEANKLLDLAKQQLLQSGELFTQEHHEKLMDTLYKETLVGVKNNWRDYFTPQAVTDIYNAGRNDVLKDLPRWKKWENGACSNGRGIPLALVVRGLNGCELVDALSNHGEKYIMLSDLEKLPGFKEDESHE